MSGGVAGRSGQSTRGTGQVIRRLPYGEPVPYPLPGDVYVPPEKPSDEFLFPLEPDMHFPNPPALGRNEPCWCGSGKTYKKCCLP